MSGINDVTMSAIEYALDGVARRADVRSHNVANVNTPGYQARTVSFESALADAIGRGDVARVEAATVTVAPGDPDPLGNTVSLEDEMVGAMKDNLMYGTLVEGFNYSIGILRAAIGGRS